MKDNYAPVYRWLGVADAQGQMIAATDPEHHRPGLCQEWVV